VGSASPASQTGPVRYARAGHSFIFIDPVVNFCDKNFVTKFDSFHRGVSLKSATGLTPLRISVTLLPMLAIRLQRVGRTNDPSFRVVVTRSTNGPKSGKFLEIVGNHNPRTHTTELNADRIKYWISMGAQPSDTLHNLLITKKIIEGKKRNVLPRKSPIKKEGEVAPAEVAVAAPASAEGVVPEDRSASGGDRPSGGEAPAPEEPAKAE